MKKQSTKSKRHPVQIPDDLWQKLWQQARKRKNPTTVAKIILEILRNHVH